MFSVHAVVADTEPEAEPEAEPAGGAAANLNQKEEAAAATTTFLGKTVSKTGLTSAHNDVRKKTPRSPNVVNDFPPRLSRLSRLRLLLDAACI